MTRATELKLYQSYARSRILDSLASAVVLKWSGDLAIGGGTAYVFAGLSTERWQILTPDMIRREVQLPGDPAKRPKWKVTLSIPRGTLLLGQPKQRDPFFCSSARSLPPATMAVGHLDKLRAPGGTTTC